MTNIETWMPEARKIASAICNGPETNSEELIESVSRVIAGWMEAAAQSDRNVQYYRGLLVRCGNALGIEARTADDGVVNDDVLVAKVPELVEKLVSKK